MNKCFALDKSCKYEDINTSGITSLKIASAFNDWQRKEMNECKRTVRITKPNCIFLHQHILCLIIEH